jgi:hypothetical protein
MRLKLKSTNVLQHGKKQDMAKTKTVYFYPPPYNVNLF